MEIIVGYLLVFYIIKRKKKRMLLHSLESPHRGDSNACKQHTFERQKKKISLNYPYIVFGGNPCGLKIVFDSSKRAIGVRAIEVLLYMKIMETIS